MKKVFEIECPDEVGEVWLDVSTVYSALQDHPHLNNANVEDITDEVQKLRRVIMALIDESITRIPQGFNQMGEDYAPRLAAHNTALMELTRALTDIGYGQ